MNFQERFQKQDTFAAGFAFLSFFIVLALNHVVRLRLAVPFPGSPGRQNYLTLAGYILPDTLLGSGPFLMAIKGAFIVVALYWIAHRVLPISSWATVLLFFLFVSLITESLYYTRHAPHAVTNVLFLFAVWYQGQAAELKKVFRDRNWTARVFPSWVIELSVYWACLTYSYSGCVKLFRQGVTWGSGTPLQLWVLELGTGPQWLRNLIIEHRTLAALMQSTTLFAECTAVLCAFYRPARPLYGAIFLGFHFVSWLVFGENFDFFGNMGIALMMLSSPFLFRK